MMALGDVQRRGDDNIYICSSYVYGIVMMMLQQPAGTTYYVADASINNNQARCSTPPVSLFF